MEHVKIFGSFLALLFGIWAIVYTAQHYRRYGLRYLKTLLIHLSMCNLLILIHFVSKYFSINLSKPGSISRSSVYVSTVISIVFFVILGMTVSLHMTSLYLRKLPVKRWILVCYTVFLIIFFVAALNPPESPNMIPGDFYIALSFIFVCIIILIEITFLVRTLVRARKSKSADNKRLIKSFSILFLLRHVTIFALIGFAFAYGAQRNLAIAMGRFYFISLNVLPLIWVIRYVSHYTAEMRKTTDMQKAVDRITSQYHISKRETEILSLLLKGKTNREIEKELFISIHTVKNHIYSIFQKLGVSSRYELIRYISEPDSVD